MGFLSGIIGFLLSPLTSFELLLRQGISVLLFEAIVFGFSFYFTYCINGYNARMLIRSRVDFAVNVFVSSVLGSMLAVFMLYLFKFYYLGRWVLLISAAANTILVYCYGYIMAKNHRCLVVVIGPSALPFKSLLLESQFDKIRRLVSVVQYANVDDLFNCGFGDLSDHDRKYFLVEGVHRNQFCERLFNSYPYLLKNVISASELIEKEFEVVDSTAVESGACLIVARYLRDGDYLRVKRIMDVLIVACLAFPAISIILLSAIIIKISDAGPVFYRQTRCGHFGKKFSILKLRSMKLDAESDGVQWAQVSDPRVTKIGKILRKTRIDELPQLWNIFLGEMSFIGPRPERPEFYEIIREDVPDFFLRLWCKPGLTGWAQINYPYGASIHDARMKLLYDLFYLKNARVMLDLKILTRTFVAMVKGAR
jgi:lipopolysaccharide/colanic/teichoic acid biosynthesis glycosyltransferase